MDSMSIMRKVNLGAVDLNLLKALNALLTKLTSLDRSQRVGVSTAYFVAVFAAIAFGLRRLQRRGSI